MTTLHPFAQSIVAILLSISLLVAPAAAEQPTENFKLSSQEIFHRYMDIASIRQTFRALQWEVINTADDTAFTHFFYQTNHFGQLFEKLKTIHNQSLEDFSQYMASSAIRVRPKFGIKDADKVDKIVVELAKGMGLSSQAIANREIYFQSGGMNAFTVSGNNERLIIVINTDLIERMTYQEIRYVLAHELWHIKSIHSVKGAMHNLFMNFAAAALGTPRLPLQTNLTQNVCSFHGNCSHHAGHSGSFSFDYLGQQNLHEDQVMNMALAQLRSLPDQEQNSLLAEYINLVAQTMMNESAPPMSILYFQELAQWFAKPTMLTLDRDFFAAHAQQALNAISRANEKSADAGALAYVKNLHGASAMVKLAGRPLRGSAQQQRKERDAYAHLMEYNAKEAAEKYKGTDNSFAIGSTHPAIAIRHSYLFNAPAYPSILFARPFYRLLLLADLLDSMSVADPEMELQRAKLHGEIIDFIGASPLTQKHNLVFDQLVQYFAADRRVILQTYEKVSQIDPAAVTNPQAREQFMAALHALQKETNKEQPLLKLLEHYLIGLLSKYDGTTTPTQSAEKFHIERRLFILRTLMTTKNTTTLKNLQEAAYPPSPKVATSKSRSSKNIPSDTTFPANPFSLCAEILGAIKMQ